MNEKYLKYYFLAQNNPEVLKNLTENPKETLEKLGVTEKDILCPEEVHQALNRANKAIEKIRAIETTTPILDLPKMAEILKSNFGDFTVSAEPFALKFSEKALLNADTTVSGTVNCTFGYSCHPDVDG